MAQNVEFILDGKEAGAVRAWLAVQRAQEAAAAGLGKIDAAQLKNTQSAIDWDRVAMRTLREIQTPQQRYNDKLKELDELRKRNKLTEEQYAAAVRKSNESLTTATETGTSGLLAVGTRLTAVVGGYQLATSAAKDWMAANVDLEKQAEAIADKYDSAFRRFRAMAGMNYLQSEAAKERITTIAVDRAVDVDQAEAGASALSSAGFSGEESSGKALNALFKITNAQQMRGKQVNPEAVAAGSAQYLASQDEELTGANLEALGVAVQSLKDTPLTFGDMTQLAKAGGALKSARVTKPEQLASYGVLRKSLDSSEAGTGLRNIALQLSTASGQKDKVAALKEMGLKPTDVDMVGESFIDVIDVIKSRLEKVAPERRNPILKSLVEGENLTAFSALSSGSAEIRQRMGALNDIEGFQKDLAIGEQGPAAAARRQKAAIELKTAEKNRDMKKLFDEVQLIDMERNVSPFDQKAFRDMAEIYIGMGYEPSQAAAASLEARNWVRPLSRLFGMADTTDSVGIVTEAQNRLEDRTRGRELLPGVLEKQAAAQALMPRAPDPAMEKNNKLLEQSINLQQQQLDEIRKRSQLSADIRADTRPAAPVPSSLNDDRSTRP